MSMNKPIFEL